MRPRSAPRLGDDLDAPADAAAPVRWALVESASDAPLPPRAASRSPLCRGAARAGSPPRADRRGARHDGRASRRPLEARPAAGLARGRSVALGRAQALPPTPRPRRPASRRAPTALADHRGRAGRRACRGRRPCSALELAETALRAAGFARENSAREARRAALRTMEAARDDLTRAERAASERGHPARRALTAVRGRLEGGS